MDAIGITNILDKDLQLLRSDYMKMLKKISITLVLCAAVCCCLYSVHSKAATSSSWSASHVNVPGVPSYESTTADITISHGKKGATAICNSVSHTNSGAYTGYTYVSCYTYSMSRLTITNTGSVTCLPSVGDPLVDVSVRYIIGAGTPTSNDTYRCSGSISKIW